jgi:hypothetical protein
VRDDICDAQAFTLSSDSSSSSGGDRKATTARATSREWLRVAGKKMRSFFFHFFSSPFFEESMNSLSLDLWIENSRECPDSIHAHRQSILKVVYIIIISSRARRGLHTYSAEIKQHM